MNPCSEHPPWSDRKGDMQEGEAQRATKRRAVVRLLQKALRYCRMFCVMRFLQELFSRDVLRASSNPCIAPSRSEPASVAGWDNLPTSACTRFCSFKIKDLPVSRHAQNSCVCLVMLLRLPPSPQVADVISSVLDANQLTGRFFPYWPSSKQAGIGQPSAHQSMSKAQSRAHNAVLSCLVSQHTSDQLFERCSSNISRTNTSIAVTSCGHSVVQLIAAGPLSVRWSITVQTQPF